jgi:flagellar biogenesis protein FliO
MPEISTTSLELVVALVIFSRWLLRAIKTRGKQNRGQRF